MTDELKPCPVCGGPAVHVGLEFITCGQAEIGYDRCIGKDIRASTAEEWNRQPQTDKLQKLLALRDRQIADCRRNWLSAAEMALHGDDKALWLMVGLANESGKVVQSAAQVARTQE